MHLRIRSIFYLAAAAISSVSCLSSVKTDGRRTVEFLPMISGEVRSSAVVTKASDAFDEFGVYAFHSDGSRFMDRARVAFDGSSWMSDEEYIWGNKTPLRFFAYTPYMKDVNDVLSEGSLRIEGYDITTATAPVCYTELSAPTERSAGPVVVLFNPATALLDFRVINGLGPDTEIRIEKIIILDVLSAGDFDSSAEPAWTLYGDRRDFTAYDIADELEPVSGIANRETREVGGLVNMIPQQPVAGIEIVFSQRSGQSEWLTGQRAFTETLEAEWEGGRRYTYTFTVTGATMIKYSLGLGNWVDRQ